MCGIVVILGFGRSSYQGLALIAVERLMTLDSTFFWMYKVRCWRWLIGNEIPISVKGFHA